MKFLHTSDWHLGRIIEKGITYEEDQRDAIEQIIKIAQDEKVDGILIAGDVYDKRKPTQDTIKMCNEYITAICKGELNGKKLDRKIPIYMVAGNHDGAQLISLYNQLVEENGLYVAGALSEEPYVVRLDEVDIYLLPWFEEHDVIGVFPTMADEVNTIEDAYRIVLEKYREAFQEGKKNILVSHSYIKDMELCDSDEQALVGTATAISSELLEGFDYVALGHIHGPQDVDADGLIRYCGTPICYSFGSEEKHEKSVTIIDTDSWDISERYIVPLHVRKTCKGSVDKLMKEEDQSIIDGYVKLDINDYETPESRNKLKNKYSHVLKWKWKTDIRINTDNSLKMTAKEYDDIKKNPETVFKEYYKEKIDADKEPSDEIMDLFNEVLEDYNKQTSEEE